MSGACIIELSDDDDRQRIANGPVYNLAKVQKLVDLHGFVVINEKAQDDQKQDFVPPLSDDELRKIIRSLEARHFHRSERCITTNNMIVDADGYSISWLRSRKCEADRPGTGCDVYVKLGFRESNPKCLILSIHN
ncbi:hypothetical protein ZRA01_37780 [Zoogloea ramigera]|uniref:Uncharacterized protein n=1 Tax=Zoogloea ramigera TaxID=350 RepID=A0A4Y4CXN1_ZOORA|nr:hypothetical protein ZRA01_37780 [Zoogloea ramigera]